MMNASVAGSIVMLTDKCLSDVYPNLDYDSDDNDNEKNDSDDIPGEQVEGVQQVYVKAIQRRVQAELSSANMSTSKLWLLKYLNNNDWWVRTVHARTIVKNLGLKLEHQPTSAKCSPCFWLLIDELFVAIERRRAKLLQFASGVDGYALMFGK
jgi:hypothetical protein